MSASTVITTENTTPAPAAYPFARQMFWSVRRELWENRSVYIAPFAAAGLLIFSVLIIAAQLVLNAHPLENANMNGDMSGGPEVWIPYVLIAGPVLGISLLVAIAYCLGALHGERRDRSILFWKSLPVSDLTTVLSKASVPLLLIPLISLLAAVIAQLTILAIVLAVFPLIAAKVGLVWFGVPITYHTVGMIWAGVPISYLTFSMLYGLLTTALWQAPIYAWLLLVGGWAKRMSFVWAIAPVGGLMLAERIVLGTDRLATIVADRFDGSLQLAFSDVVDNRLPELTPGHFVSDPGLWIGLAVAAIFLGAAVLLRRYRQPI